MIPDFDGLREVVHFPANITLMCYRNQEAEDYPSHWHSDIEVIMPLENEYTVQIDHRDYVLKEGDILFIPPGVIHELFAPAQGSRMIIQISYALISAMNGFYETLHHFYPCLFLPVRSEDTLVEQLRFILMGIDEEFRVRGPFHGDMLEAYARQFLVLLARNGDAYGTRQSYRRYTKSVDGFLRVCDYINRHCIESLTISQLAEVAGYSKSHFLRMFKEFSNISCGEYIQRQRVALARQLLADPECSITEIVTQAGFGSVASFNRVFREQMDCTPTQYRKMIRGDNQNI